MAFGKFGKYYPDGVDLRPTRFDLREFLQTQINEVEELEGRHHTMRYSADKETLEIYTDAKHLRYIVINLLHNAVKYSPRSSEVELKLLSENGIRICVSDNGIGIPAEEQNKLFSPFYRASNVGDKPGTGMGLAIVKKSANLISARLELQSDDGGTRFTVHLTPD